MPKRPSGVKLDASIPNYIAPYNLDKLSRRHHPLGNFPVYPKNGEPDQYFEEKIATERYTQLVTEFCRIHQIPTEKLIKPGQAMMYCAQLSAAMRMLEGGKFRQLERLAEDTIREYYDLGKDEVLFDLEILDIMSGKKPADFFDFNKSNDEVDIHDPAFEEDLRDEIVRRRLTNALIQGASLKGHYLFHMASERLESLIPGATKVYNHSMITNDLTYYYIDDVICSKMTEREEQAGMMEVDFSGDVPVIRVKAMCFTVLVHEMVKGVMEMLSSVGLPKDPVMAKQVLDTCDTVLNEFWDIRLGPRMWEMFFELIPNEDHDLLKHVLVGVFQLETDEFLGFAKSLFYGTSEAKELVEALIKAKRFEILDHKLNIDYSNIPPEKDFSEGYDPNKDGPTLDDIDGIDWNSLF